MDAGAESYPSEHAPSFVLGAEQPHGARAVRALLQRGAEVVLLGDCEAALRELASTLGVARHACGARATSDDTRTLFAAARRAFGCPGTVFIAVSCAEPPEQATELALRDYQRVNADRLRQCYLAIRAAAEIMRHGSIIVAGAAPSSRVANVLCDEGAWLGQLTGLAAFRELVIAADGALLERGIRVRLMWQDASDERSVSLR